jgi:DNA repair protein RecO (recombination protein O)
MPLHETESLVLKSYNLAEADRIVVFFTQEHGVVRGVARGAKRLKSRFGSTLEPFSTVHLSYFQKEDRELVSIQQVELVKSCFAIAADPEFLHTFSYVAELLLAFTPPHDPNEKLYRMIKACLAAPADTPEGLEGIRLYFELWLLRLGGYLPDWGRCDECGRPFAETEESSLRNDFHVVCANCRRSQGMAKVTPVERDVFYKVQKLPPPDFLEYIKGRNESVAAVSGVMGRIISQILGKEVAGGKLPVLNQSAGRNAA